MEYCDYIADRIRQGLHQARQSTGAFGDIVCSVGRTKSDLHPTEGWLQSTTKTILVEDKNGQKYKVTVEAVENDNA